MVPRDPSLWNWNRCSLPGIITVEPIPPVEVVPLFQRVGFGDLYSRINLTYRIDDAGVEYELLVSPGVIRLR